MSIALAGALVSGGFEVVAVGTGRDGLARLGDRDPYDAVLTDYVMPDMTGVEFLVRVAARPSWLPMLMNHWVRSYGSRPSSRKTADPLTAQANPERGAAGSCARRHHGGSSGTGGMTLLPTAKGPAPREPFTPGAPSPLLMGTPQHRIIIHSWRG